MQWLERGPTEWAQVGSEDIGTLTEDYVWDSVSSWCFVGSKAADGGQDAILRNFAAHEAGRSVHRAWCDDYPQHGQQAGRTSENVSRWRCIRALQEGGGGRARPPSDGVACAGFVPARFSCWVQLFRVVLSDLMESVMGRVGRVVT